MIAKAPSYSFASFTALAAILAFAGCVVACGAGGEAKSPESYEPDPSTVEEAQQRIERARAELDGRGSPAKTLESKPPESPSADRAPPAAPSPSPPVLAPQSERQSVHESGAGASSPKPAPEDRCARPCRALESMRRAVSALCRMTGTDDARCTDAKRTLTESERSISPCSC